MARGFAIRWPFAIRTARSAVNQLRWRSNCTRHLSRKGLCASQRLGTLRVLLLLTVKLSAEVRPHPNS